MSDTKTPRKPKVAADRLIVETVDAATLRIVKDLGPCTTLEATRVLKALAKVTPGAYTILYRPSL